MCRASTRSFAIAIAAMIIMAMSASADVPQLINYQGRLTDSEGEPVSDIVALTFTIYDDSTGGNIKWTEINPTVVVENGLFHVLLGAVNPIPDTVFSGSSRYLGIKVDTDAEITPRNRLVSAGYAYRSSRADTADYPQTHWAVNDSVLYTNSPWGLARGGAGNVLHGTGKHTHVNLGIECVTGLEGEDNLYATVCGGYANSAFAHNSFVGGGAFNIGSGFCSAISGGTGNVTNGNYSSIGGGLGNDVYGKLSYIGGGQVNVVFGDSSCIVGGFNNEVHADLASILGGNRNVISGGGKSSVILGGVDNEVDAMYALAAGFGAKALHDKSFVWNGSSSNEFQSTNSHQFLISASNGVGINTNNPQSTLHLGGTSGVDGIIFPDGTKQTTAAVIPAGVIVMWSGTLATIPSGWALCDGTNGTPNLTDRFIYGVSSGQNPGPTGGNAAHTHTVDPASFSSGNPSQLQGVNGSPPAVNVGSMAHTHIIDVPATTSSSTNHLPPYYKLAFIMKL